jgi:DNA-binding winged helix-turn-helix (wHTH) protein/tetratricopeptide (TPR) repeat protein
MGKVAGGLQAVNTDLDAAAALDGYRVGDLLIDLRVRRVTREAVELRIGSRSFDLLVALIRAAPSLMSTDELLESVWPGVIVNPETITQRIKLLRQDLGDSAENPVYIAAVRGHGYRLVPTVVPLAVLAHPAPAPDSSPPAGPQLQPRTGRYFWIPLLTALMLLAVIAAIWRGLQRIPPSKDVQAYELYMQARSVSRGTDASERLAASLLDQAIAQDPDFADALGLRAITHAGAVALSSAPLSLLEAAERDAERALALNPRSAEANTAQELIYALRGDWVAAEQRFRAAMAVGSNDPIMRTFHDMILLRPTGRLQQARTELTETYHLAPGDGFTAHELALTYSLLAQDADAIRFGDLGEQIGGEGPPHSDIDLVRARAAARAGRYTDAVAFAVRALPESLRRIQGEQAIQAFYAALANSENRNAALGALRSLLPTLKTNVIEGRTRMFFIDAFTMIGALDEAYDLAEWSVDQRAKMPGSVEWSDVWMPEMHSFRTDSRFRAFVSRLKLPDYWRVYGPPDECEFRNAALACH